jgi:PAS domain S-box-containing protein
MKLWTRLAAAMILLVALTAAAVGWLSYRNLEQTVTPRALERIEDHAQLLALDIRSYVETARADIGGFRSAVALNGMIRARSAGGLDPIDGTTEATWRQRMAARYAVELESKPSYAQFRIIGASDNAREIVRVDRLGPNGAIRIAPDNELQTTGDSDYIKEALKSAPGSIYVSPISLSREHGAVQTPHVPTIRVATPIYTSGNELFGIVVINVDMRPVFDRIRDTARPGGGVYVVNDRGDFLVHPDPSREFGFDLGKPVRWQDEFPDLAQDFDANVESDTYEVKDAAGDRGGATVVSLTPGGGPRISIIETIPYETIMLAATSVRDTTMAVAIAAILVAGLLAVLLARSLANPLTQMSRSVQGFARGAPVALPTSASGEIGDLARSFAAAFGEIRDKTAELQREVEERRRVIEVLNNTIGSMVDPVVVADEHGKIVMCNPPAAKIGTSVGTTPATWSKNYSMFFADGITPVPFEQRPIVRARKGEVIENVEIVVHDATIDKTMVLAVNGGPIRGSAGQITGAVAIYHDVTALKESERQLRQSQKMEAIGQLTGGIAHDFNNILTVITGTIEILAQEVEDKPDMVAIAKMIDEAATRGAELTQRLLAFARRQPLQPRKTDINTLALEAAKLLRPTLGEQIEIESMLDSDAWTAMIDPGQLTTALINLALNARDAMPNGGKLTIETGNVYLDDGYARSNPEVMPGPYLMVAVSDTGTGIPASLRERVFEPFFTTKEIGKGTGLGLSMVYGFIKQSGGHIKIYSEEGHGTTVKMYLPRAADGVDPSEGMKIDSSAERGSESILVVEDDDLVRTYVCAQLRSLGYTAIPVADAAQALVEVDRGTKFDLLFTDVIMPGPMNGRRLADELVKRRPDMKVLFTSGYTENAIVHHGRLDPGVLLLAKPYRKIDLARMVRQALDNHVTVA